MAATSLLLCRDPQVLDVLGEILEDLGVAVEICTARESAIAMLGMHKFNPVIVDYDGFEGSSDWLKQVREITHHRDSITLGIVNSETNPQAAFDTGANFVLRKPVSSTEARQTLRTALSLITKMQRKFIRKVVHTLAYAAIEGVNDHLMIMDIGEGGMAVQALEKLQMGALVSIRFDLPGTPIPVEATGEVVWSDDSGRAGFRFLVLPDNSRQQLRQWVSDTFKEMAEIEPGHAAEVAPERIRLPLQLAPAFRHVLIAAGDAVLVVAALALFTFTFLRFTRTFPAVKLALTAGVLFAVAFWGLYQYLFNFFKIETPGVRLTKILADGYLAFSRRRQAAQVNSQ